MWQAMRVARLGWATYGDDPSVNELEEVGAELLGKDAAVLVPTCGMANLVALLVLAREGDAVVAEAEAHVLVSEALGIVHVARSRRPTVGSTPPRWMRCSAARRFSGWRTCTPARAARCCPASRRSSSRRWRAVTARACTSIGDAEVEHAAREARALAG
jgi:hypothetical protein